MKVLHVNDVANVASNLVHGLRELGVEADLFPVTKARGRYGNVPLAVLPFVKTREAFQLHKFVKDGGFDVVHVHFALHAYMTLITGLPYFLHVHGSDVRKNRFPGLRILNNLGIRAATRVFYATPDLRAQLKRVRPDAVFLPDPVNTEEFRPGPAKARPSRRVLCISKLDQFKGVSQSLRAVELIWRVRPETEIAMFSFGNASVLARSFIQEHQNESRLILLPRIPHCEMPHLIRSFDVVLGQQSPLVGALGVSELEAMACSKPVVCFFRYPEMYLEPPPVLVSRSPEESCDRVVELLDTPGLARSLGHQARKWVVQHHGTEAVARALLKLYCHGES